MKELKISLPPYKIICALFFILILSIVRGISEIDEIGPTIDTYMALLALVLCADTCHQEVQESGWEILALKPGKRQRQTILKRFAVQYIFIFCMAAAGYGMFYLIQQPSIGEQELYHFATAMAASASSIVLFGAMPVFLAKITGNLIGAMGAAAAFWFFITSSWAEKLPRFLQIFAFGGRNISEGEMWWISGKVTALILGAVFMAAVGDFGRHLGVRFRKGYR